LAKARADGIVTRSNVNLSASITRLQVAQLAASAMKLNTTNLSSVKPFTDTSDAAVQALNAAGIVEGYFSNGTSTFKPNNTLTRGQVSAIVWRMRNYSK
ncbi:MAG: S-layer homology domain-containing protein, partial [Oscillospiraceae bacterium]|nr:S-layer homology domain-containing protein [Oscillospiraceae bacterium]